VGRGGGTAINAGALLQSVVRRLLARFGLAVFSPVTSSVVLSRSSKRSSESAERQLLLKQGA
jgi:hypothetical protein